jgi:tryptophan synthase beta subunit
MAYNTPYTEDAVDATITVGAEISNARAISVQFLDANGANMDGIVRCELHVLLDAAGADFVATGGSTGIAAGASGKILATVAKKIFKAYSTAAGLLAISWTDTGTEAAYLGVLLPNGRMVISSALTNA